jgi:hypothetical protein
VLLASVALNVVLAARLAGMGPGAAAPRPALERPGALQGADAGAVLGASADAAEHARWLALGLTSGEAAQLLLARVAADERAAVAPAAASYWQPAARSAGAEAAARLDAEDAIRARLVAVLGAEASALDELATVFRPLDAELGFLSSDEQLAVRRVRLERAIARGSAATDGRGPPSGAPDEAAELDALRAVLTPERALEVALRSSALATQLRDSGVGLSEREFRAAFELLRNAKRDARSQLELRAELARLLGDRRFHQLWSQRDPLAGVVRRAGASLGLTGAAVEQAYAVLNAAQGRLLGLAVHGGDVERLAAEAQSIADEERRALEAAVGAAAADDLIAARSRFLAEAARTPPPGP